LNSVQRARRLEGEKRRKKKEGKFTSCRLTIVVSTHEKLYSECVVKVWNSLPQSIVNFSSLATFRNSLIQINIGIHTKYWCPVLLCASLHVNELCTTICNFTMLTT